MKPNKKTYFSFFFLFCFLASFSINTFSVLKLGAQTPKSFKNNASYSYSQKENSSASNAELLFEENENEDEHDFAINVFIAPYVIAYFISNNASQKNNSVNPLTEKQSNPIYLQVCNFRI